MEEALKIVSQLVKDFKEQEKAYLSSSYQESQVRQDFIDKFFIALGWDVTHEKQKNPYEQEVKIENRVRMESSQRYADYAFFIAPNYRDVKFFVEAKKPAKDLSNPEYYYQTIRYGWNQSTPISILTDFEEFHIIDCRYKPNIKNALDRKLELFHYSQYIDEEIFKKIFYLFGREAVLNGSIEKYVGTLARPRGKGVDKGVLRTVYQQVDQAFLELLDDYRDKLAHAFKNKNQHLTGEELTEAVQRTIDRLVFIRFLEDKGIEEKTILGFKSKPSSWISFLGFCKSLEPKYNGLVFKGHPIIDAPKFKAPDENIFAEICSELADPSSPYDFNSIPISILGNIYERFLGKVVTTTDKRAKIIEKPEVRKVGGVYYTPEYIVRYIVNETVGKLIEGKTPEQIRKMAFADIACGSGSFLLEVYNKLLEYHTKYYTEHPEKAKKGDIEKRSGRIALSHKKRQEILTNNIYGVDIDSQATEVTQLSLYLKLMEDVTMNDAYQFSLLKERMLPDLKHNIVCGNSLIGRDILDGKLLDNESERALKPMNFKDVFPAIVKRGGFDAVVGNPPYVRQESLGEYKSYFEAHYKVYHGAADLYTYFIEMGFTILKDGGLFSYIVANKWMRANYGKPLRKWLKKQCIEEIIDFGDLPVFKSATTYPCIIRLKKSFAEKLLKVIQVKSLEFLNLITYVNEFAYEINQSNLQDSGWSLSNERALSLLEKLKGNCCSLGEYINGKIFYGIKTGLNEAFVIDENTKSQIILEDPKSVDLIKPFLMGRDIKRYESPKSHRYLIFTRRGVDIKKYPSIEKYLSRFKESLMPKPLSFKGSIWKGRKAGSYKWYEIQDAVNYFPEFEKPKIIVPAITQTASYAYDTKSIYSNDKTSIIPTTNLYLFGLLNSKVCDFVMHRISSTKQGGYYEYKPMYLEQLPIRTINFGDAADKSRHDNIVALVEQILSQKAKYAKANTESEKNRFEIQIEALDRQIDAAVYELYGLTEDEIKIVEGTDGLR